MKEYILNDIKYEFYKGNSDIIDYEFLKKE